jgi:hydroxymethylbilane synthase
MPDSIKIGSRGSALARWQSDYVADKLRQHYPKADIEVVIFTTRGDKILDKSLPSIGGKGLFTAELEQALLDHTIDCAVHSLKDLPTDEPEGLTVGAVPQRAPVEDVLVSKGGLTFDELPEGAAIGTSSLRRAAQLRYRRPDVTIIDIRGNVPTRIDKALNPDSDYDAIVLARAGVERLNLMEHVAEILPLEMVLNAPGQGALGIQTRTDDDALALLQPLVHDETRLAVITERAFLNTLEGGCSVPVAAYGSLDDDGLHLHGRVSRVDGSQHIDLHDTAPLTGIGAADTIAAEGLGRDLARRALQQGADEILAEVRQ